MTTISFRILYGVYFRIEEIHALFQLFFTFSGVLRALIIGFTDVTLSVGSHGCYRQAPWCSVYRIGKYLTVRMTAAIARLLYKPERTKS